MLASLLFAQRPLLPGRLVAQLCLLHWAGCPVSLFHALPCGWRSLPFCAVVYKSVVVAVLVCSLALTILCSCHLSLVLEHSPKGNPAPIMWFLPIVPSTASSLTATTLPFGAGEGVLFISHQRGPRACSPPAPPHPATAAVHGVSEVLLGPSGHQGTAAVPGTSFSVDPTVSPFPPV